MMRKFLIGLAALICVLQTNAQTEKIAALPNYKIGIFAPLYLDSIFTSTGTLKFKDVIPRYTIQGMDFVQGAQIALDSMDLPNATLQVYIYDTKSYTQSIPTLIKNKALDSLNLMIGSVKDIEFKQLSDFALAKNVPFISATYPNDGGITNNPFTVIVNSTLKAHCEAIYSYILQNHGLDKVYLFTKKGAQESKIASYFKALNSPDGKPMLNIINVKFDSSTASSDYVKTKLDSNAQNIIIGGSLDEDFASSLASACYDLHQTYPITLIGMPNWDAFKSLMNKDDFEDFPIYFTTPYFNTKWDNYSKMVNNAYALVYKGKPTDMVFKGFECTYLFAKLLCKYPTDFMNRINDKSYKIFSDYNFKPVTTKKEYTIPDYFENKHLYFIKILNGATYKAW